MLPTPPQSPSGEPGVRGRQEAMKCNAARSRPSPPALRRPYEEAPQLSNDPEKLSPRSSSNSSLDQQAKPSEIAVTEASGLVQHRAPGAPCRKLPSLSKDSTPYVLEKSRASSAASEDGIAEVSVARLTSLLLEKQDLDGQLHVLEGILKGQSAPSPSLILRKPMSSEPFTQRLAGILSSPKCPPGKSNPSSHPSLCNPPADFPEEQTLEIEHRMRPAPLNPRVSQSEHVYSSQELPRCKKVVDIIKESFQETALGLAEVELKIELVYLNADRWIARHGSRWASRRRQPS